MRTTGSAAARLLALCVVLAVAPTQGAVACARPGHDAASASADDDEGLRVAGRHPHPAAEELAADFDLDLDQAERQIQRWAAAAIADAEMPTALSTVFSGSRIFHDDGGRVEVTITDRTMAAAFREHYASHGLDDVDVVVGALTRDEAESLAREIDDELQASRPAGAKARAPVPGQITVTVGSGDLDSVEKEIVDTARQNPDAYRLEYVDRVRIHYHPTTLAPLSGTLGTSGNCLWVDRPGGRRTALVMPEGSTIRATDDRRAAVDPFGTIAYVGDAVHMVGGTPRPDAALPVDCIGAEIDSAFRVGVITRPDR